jgi:hypothetical protein
VTEHRRLVRALAIVVAATVALAIAFSLVPSHTHLVAGMWAVVVAVVGSQALLHWARAGLRPSPPKGRTPAGDPFTREGWRLRRLRSKPSKPQQLSSLEDVVVETAGRSGDPRRRLMPLLDYLEQVRGELGEGQVSRPGWIPYVDASPRRPLHIDVGTMEALVDMAEKEPAHPEHTGQLVEEA